MPAARLCSHPQLMIAYGGHGALTLKVKGDAVVPLTKKLLDDVYSAAVAIVGLGQVTEAHLAALADLQPSVAEEEPVFCARCGFGTGRHSQAHFGKQQCAIKRAAIKVLAHGCVTVTRDPNAGLVGSADVAQAIKDTLVRA